MKSKERSRGIPSPCQTCGRKYAPLRGAECVTCYRFRKRTGKARPYGKKDGRPAGVPRGPDHKAWKGDAARTETKRARAQRMFPLGKCELCDKAAVDRHHKDGDTGNNKPKNVQRLCRHCHMKTDGRLATFLSHSKGRATP